MSGVIGIIGGGADTAERARAMLGASRGRGADQQSLWHENGYALGACAHGWELGADFAAGGLTLITDRLIVAADASLYYRAELRQALTAAGSPPPDDSPAQLVAAAYLAWGEEGLSRLEGDFAVLLWDRRDQALLAARDSTGARQLFFAEAHGGLVIGSVFGAVAGVPGVSRELNRMAIAESAFSAASLAVEDTEYAAVRRVPAGHLLRFAAGKAPAVRRLTESPRFDSGREGSFEDGARQLRAILGQAVRERMSRTGETSVWMSGGYDSPSIFALARSGAGAGQGVTPVSMSYPEGDTGREDELIQAVADFHRARVEWIRIADVPGHEPMDAWAARRDEAFAHHYEPWNRALAQGSRRAGARIALSGNGGDQFFSVSPVYLSDLLRSGRWWSLAREARGLGFGIRGYRNLIHWAIQPTLPAAVHRMIGAVRGGRPLRPHLQMAFPEWIHADPALREALRARQWHYHHRRPDETMSSAESNWYLNTTFGPRVSGLVSSIALGEGVEVRSPMFDPRVLAFLASRPRRDRFAVGENKLLLRAAVTGLLPEAHLARRARRTGLPGGYLVRTLPTTLRAGLDGLKGEMRLAALQIVDSGALGRAFERFFRSPQRQSDLGAQLFEILSVEYWLRAHA